MENQQIKANYFRFEVSTSKTIVRFVKSIEI